MDVIVVVLYSEWVVLQVVLCCTVSIIASTVTVSYCRFYFTECLITWCTVQREGLIAGCTVQ